MTWLSALKVLLQLAVFFARRADKLDTEKAILNELQVLHTNRVNAAVRARDDVLAGRMPIDPADKHRRD